MYVRDIEASVREEFGADYQSLINSFCSIKVVQLLKLPLFSDRIKNKQIEFANFWLDSLIDGGTIWSD